MAIRGILALYCGRASCHNVIVRVDRVKVDVQVCFEGLMVCIAGPCHGVQALLQPCAPIIDLRQCSGLEVSLVSIQDCCACTRLPIPGVVHACKGEPQGPKLAARRPQPELWLGMMSHYTFAKTCT